LNEVIFKEERMKQEEFNNQLRDIFTTLINDGFKKSGICQRVLGNQRLVQFDTFLKGTDLGIKPLMKMIESFGYELHLVPIRNEDTELINKIEEITEEFSEYAHIMLNESLTDDVTNSSRKSQTKEAAKAVIQQALMSTPAP